MSGRFLSPHSDIGSAFTGGSGDHHWDFGYNARSELVGGERPTGTTPGQGTLFTLKGDFDYAYDPIGNRETGTTYADMDTTRYSTTYTTNNVNQYTATSDPAESFTYDEDGNLKTDGTFTYTWDAGTLDATANAKRWSLRLAAAPSVVSRENRLIAVQTKRAGDPVDGDTRVEFKYDTWALDTMRLAVARPVALRWPGFARCSESRVGRRVEKKYSLRSGSSWVVQPGYPQRFVYDEWNVVLVLNGSGEPTRKFTWGLDLSGTIHGAGGIGGLLAVEETQGTFQGAYWFFYDGNGNVGQLVKTVKDGQGNITGVESTLAAHYEYDPYGNVINSTGPYKDANPFRFSTKWFDAETDLGYWGYRYYSPRLGRWISRDPIGEAGGSNVMSYGANAPSNTRDALGLAVSEDQCYGPPTQKVKCLRLKMLQKNCRTPKLVCKSCCEKWGGWFDPNSVPPEIVMCVNNLNSMDELVRAMEHEYRHALQYCTGNNKQSCDARACREIQAYYCSGQCDPPNGLWLRPGETKDDCVKRYAAASLKADPKCVPIATSTINAQYSKAACKDCSDCP